MGARNEEAARDRAAFLTALYESSEPGYFFSVATFPDKRCEFFEATEGGISDAADYIERVDDGRRHVFSSMYLLDAKPEHGRGTIADVRAIVGMWADVDVGKVGYARNLNEALKIIDAIPLRPSLVTCSGVGAHAYWLFKEPLSLETDHERADALDLLAHWKATVTAIASENGGKVDAGTFDAARVMRVSGTQNPKVSPPSQAYIILQGGPKYSPSDFDPILRDTAPITSSAAFKAATLDAIDIRVPEALPHVFALAIEQDDVLRLTWERARADLSDQSGSGYCMSLANQCVTLGLSDPQIAQIICAWRDAHGQTEKDRQWYERTLGKARAEKTVSSTAAAFVEAAAAGEVTDRDAILAGMSEIIGAPIEAIYRIGGPKHCLYRVKIKDKPERHIGTAADCLSQKAWTHALMDVGILAPAPPKEVWKTFCAQMIHVITDVDLDELSEASMATQWVTDYLTARKLEKGLSIATAWEQGRPYWDRSGQIVVFYSSLLASINKPGQRQIDGSEFTAAMRNIGAIRISADARRRNEARGTTHPAWRLPPGFGGLSPDDE